MYICIFVLNKLTYFVNDFDSPIALLSTSALVLLYIL